MSRQTMRAMVLVVREDLETKAEVVRRAFGSYVPCGLPA